MKLTAVKSILSEAQESRFLSLDSLDAVIEDDASFDRNVDLLNRHFADFYVEAPGRNAEEGNGKGTPERVRPAGRESYSQYVRAIQKRQRMTRDEEYLFSKRMEFFKRRLVSVVLAADLTEEDAESYLQNNGCSGATDPTNLCPVCIRIGRCPNGKKTLIHSNCGGYNMCRAMFVERNLPLVVVFTRAYRTYGIPIMDLVQEGNVALIRAVEKYDWRKKVRFQTYAEFWIRQGVERAIAASKGIVRLPNYVQQRMRRLKREGRLPVNGHRMSAKELSEVLEISADLAGRIIETGQKHVSLDILAQIGEHSNAADLVSDFVPMSRTRDEMETIRRTLWEALGILRAKERTVIKHRFGLAGEEPKTLEKLGKMMNVSRERVRQVQIRALEKLRHTGIIKSLKGFCDSETI
jgi:RNA polymerase sigma factor (sigma-70 family)